MKDLAFLVNNQHRSIDVNKMIMEQIFSVDFVDKSKRKHVSVITLQQTNCFRSATFIRHLVQRIEKKNKGVIIVNPSSIHYGTGEIFHEILSSEEEVGNDLSTFVHNDITSESDRSKRNHNTIIMNFMEFSPENLKYVPNWLNGMVVTNRTHGLDIFILFEKRQLQMMQSNFIKVLQNTDNLIFVDDFDVI